ncbi:Phage-related minor tail protein [uncultured Clostridium sp.]|nr:Phage-related minor tail protein [uncultured Clostridium sp.]
MSQETISELLVQLGLDTSDFDNNIKNVNRSTKQLETAFNGAKKALALSEKGVEDYTKAISSGESVIKQYQSKIDALGTAYKEQEQKLKGYLKQQEELPTTIAKAEQELKELEQSLGKSSNEYKKAENELKKYKQQLANMDTTINKSVNSMRSLENQIQNTQNRISQAENEVGQFRNELMQLDNLSIDGVGSIFDSIKESVGNVDLDEFTSQIDGLGGSLDLISLGATGAGLALAGMITSSIINNAIEYDGIIFDLRTNLGLIKESAELTGDKLRDLASEGYEAKTLTDAYTQLKQVFKDMNEDELLNTAKNLAVLNDMGFENEEMIGAISKAMSAWGLTADEALGLIIEGHQNGLNRSGDWLETLQEYSPVFASMGIDGVSFLNMMIQGFDETKSTSDNLADSLKEIGLKFTEGSDDVRDAFKELGLDFDKLKKQVDDGKITMPDAISKISTALDNVKDTTDRAELAQRILAGTYEMTGTFGVDANKRVIGSTEELVGALDRVNQAYDETFEKSKRELSGQWTQLTSTLGSLVIPILTQIIESLNRVMTVSQLSVTNFGIQIQTWANQLKAFFQEVGIGILESLANLPFAQKIMPNLDSTLSSMKTNHEETIRYIQNNERLMKDNSALINAEYQSDKEKTFSNVANTADQKTKEMANAINTNTADAKNKAKTNTDALKTDVETALSGLGNVALTSTGEIPKATQQNLSESAMIIRQFGSDAYNGVKTSFSKLEQSAKQSMSNLYNGCSTSMSKTKTNVIQDATTMYNQSKKSFDALAQAGRSAFSNLYNGVTTSSSRMKSKVIEDWNSIRNTLSKGITGKVSVTKSISTVTNTPKAITPIDTANESMSRLRAENLNYRASSYQPTQIVSSSSKRGDKVNNDTISELKNQNKLLTQILEVLMSERITLVENTINLDSKAIARGTAKYIESEISTINNRRSRLRSIF